MDQDRCENETDRHIDDRQVGRQTNRYRDGQTEGQIDIWTDRQLNAQTEAPCMINV